MTIIERASLLQLERKHLSSLNLALLLVHDFLFGGGIQAGDGPIKQAVKRHKTRLQAELVRLKVANGVTQNEELAIQSDVSSSKRNH
jgi:25S rRNA (cytosine2278-C5)-methyltransferase